MKHRANLDILRAFAVSCVLLDHLFLTLHSYAGVGSVEQTYYMTSLGHAGVLAFFVHTSLVLMYSLERMRKASHRVAAAFYIRRFFRIYPLAIVAVIFAVAFHIPYKTYDLASLKPLTHAGIVANLFLVQNIFTKQQVLSPMWSLPYEVQMYIVLPLLFMLASRKRAPLYLGSLFVSFCLFGTFVAFKTGHLNMAAYVPCFICGVLCYSLRNRVLPRLPAFLWVPFLLVLIGALVTANPGENQTYWSGWIYCLILGLAINMFCDSEAKALNCVSGKVALYSYGMYLLHTAALYLVFLRLHIRNLYLGSLLFAVLTVIVSMITFYAIESPFIEIGYKLSSSSKGAGPVANYEVSTAP